MERQDVYATQGFGQQLGFGDSIALVIVDFINAFADPEVLGGGNIREAITATKPVLAAAREAGLPIAFTRHVFAADGSDHGLFNIKAPSVGKLTLESGQAEVIPELAPRPGELVLDKRYPSAFFGTYFSTWLTTKRVDTLVIAGCVTSGCIRATAVDALCLGFRPIVLRECVGDRAPGPHEANLFDIQQKYGDVVPRAAFFARIGATLAA